MGSLCCSSKIHGFHCGVPMFIVPRHKRDTFRPERPRLTYSMIWVSLTRRSQLDHAVTRANRACEANAQGSDSRVKRTGGVERIRDFARGGKYVFLARQS